MMLYRKIVIENMGRKRIIFITFYMYLKEEEEGTETLTGHDKRKQCAACFALSLSLPLSFLHIEFFHHPRVPPSTASVAYVPKITCCLFCFFVAAVFHVTVTTCWKRTRAPRDNKLFTIIYRLFFCQNINNL